MAVLHETKKYVVVTTDDNRRGVFCGYLDDETKDIVILSEARMIVYWSKETRGVLGLASSGPASGSRVSPKIPILKINGITAIMECTDKAKKELERGIWE